MNESSLPSVNEKSPLLDWEYVVIEEYGISRPSMLSMVFHNNYNLFINLFLL